MSTATEFRKTLEGISFDDARERVQAALASEGFGILTEIDIQATFRKKLEVEFPRYIILGACNPPLAHRALSAYPDAGLLLPCNVVLSEPTPGAVEVVLADPEAMLRAVPGAQGLEAPMREARERLERVLLAL